MSSILSLRRKDPWVPLFHLGHIVFVMSNLFDLHIPVLLGIAHEYLKSEYGFLH
jgi:hypothetical protein